MADKGPCTQATKWAELGIRIRVAIITALFTLACGWGLTIASFALSPTNEIADSVLFCLGQAMIYSGSILGFSMHVNSEEKKLKEGIANYIRENMPHTNK